MWRFFLTLFLIAIVVWVVVDALYWNSGDFPGLFPDRRYIAMVSITVAVAVILWVIHWSLRKTHPKKPR